VRDRGKHDALPNFTRSEEIANSVTHGIGTLLSVAGLIRLLVLASARGSALHTVSFIVYGATLISLHLASTLYHGARGPRLKRALRIADHGAIYLLIAGTYTPFTLISLRGPWGYTMLVVIWVLALAGVAFKTLFIGRFRRLSVLTYVLMGWLCVIAAHQMWLHIPKGGLIWLLAGGLSYTAGIAFYGWKRLPYHHAIWHLFVLGGSACHYFAVLFYVLPAR
jgi:hemolysin III